CRDSDAAIARLCQFIGIDPPAAPASEALSRHTLTPPSPDKWRKHEQAIKNSKAIWQPVANAIGSTDVNMPITPAQGATMNSPEQSANEVANNEPPDFSSVFTSSLAQLLGQ